MSRPSHRLSRPLAPATTLLLLLGLTAGPAACTERSLEDERSGEACALQGAAQSCAVEGQMFCDEMADPEDLQWGPCLPAQEVECTPGEQMACDAQGMMECALVGGVPTWDDSNCFSDETGTPLVLRFDDAPVQFTPMATAGFDINGDGACDAIDWPTPETPWLALDRDESGGIEVGAELFGSGVWLAQGRRAEDGFEALAELDSDGDGAITPEDARWSELRTWSDHDGDRMGVGHELEGLDDVGLLRIELSYRVDRLCDARGNCGVERADFVYRDRDGSLRTGEVVDVHLACQ